ncbi:MAG: hypothetical protein ACUVT3_10205 [Ignavibacterium sp.]
MTIDDFFGTIPQTGSTENRKTAYFNTKTPGTYSVQFLEPFKSAYTHYIKSQKISVYCLDADCPVCQQNNALITTFGSEAYNKPNFNPKSLRFSANILDHTPMVTCPNCGNKVYKHAVLNGVCPLCSGVIPPNTPVEKPAVRLASFSKSFVELLKAQAASVFDEDGSVASPLTYIVNVLVTSTGKTKQVIPIIGSRVRAATVPQEEKYDLDSIAIRFTKDELVEILRGVAYKDVLGSRNLTSVNASIPPSVDTPEVQAEVDLIASKLSELFG